MIMRAIEQAYVQTANGTFVDSTTGENTRYSLRQKPEPTKKGIGYKVFVLKDGKLYPPKVANPNGAETPVGVWLDADAAPVAGETKTGRPQVKQGGKGTEGGSGKLAYRPGWHLGLIPYALQFNRKDAEGKMTLFPANFVFAEVEYAADKDYQEEAHAEGVNANGKYQHSLAGLKHLPTDGFYMYRTNPNPETDPWVITGAMKVNRILTRAEQADLVKKAGREPQQIQDGDIVTDEVVNSLNQKIADTPKFSLKVYHGSQADFDHFDHSFMGSGEGTQAFGWGTYVSEVEGIAKTYATLNSSKHGNKYLYKGKKLITSDVLMYDIVKDMLLNGNSAEDAIHNVISVQEELMKHYEDNLLGKLMIPKIRNDIKRLQSLNPSDFKVEKASRNLYEVEIPDDTGNNYLDWDKPLTDEQQKNIYQALYDLPKGQLNKMAKGNALFRNLLYKIVKNIDKETAIPALVSSNTITQNTFMDAYDTPNTGATAYHRLTDWMGGKKEASQFLSKAGFTGVKVIANHNAGGNKEGKMNYVIFDENDAKIVNHNKFSLKDNIQPIGKNQFGNVYDQFKDKPKDAFDFLLKNKSGYLKGVFHRNEIGDIDLVYGSAPNPYKGKGLAHIIRKHVETLKDFSSVDEAIDTIIDVIGNGKVKDGTIPNTFDIEKGNYRVVVAADKNGNWVLTAFDFINSAKKKKKGTATALPPSQPSDGAGAVAPNLSAAKIDNSSETAKENAEKFS